MLFTFDSCSGYKMAVRQGKELFLRFFTPATNPPLSHPHGASARRFYIFR